MKSLRLISALSILDDDRRNNNDNNVLFFFLDHINIFIELNITGSS